MRVSAKVTHREHESSPVVKSPILQPIKKGRDSSLLDELSQSLDRYCPDFNAMINRVRHFASSQLSFEKMTVVGVISAHKSEGRTTFALNLAAALADIHNNVLFVETDHDNESIARELGDPQTVGLAEYLNNEAELEDVIQPASREGLWVLPCGNSGKASPSLKSLSSVRMLLSLLRPRHDVTVVDLPPFMASEEVPALVSFLDAVVIVVEAGRSTPEDVAAMVTQCGSVPIKGIVLNRESRAAPKWLMSILGN